MKIPTIDLMAPREEGERYLTLPAVAVIAAGGFLRSSATVARLGVGRQRHTFLLLTFEQRSAVTRAVGYDVLGNLAERIPGDMDRPAVLSSTGKPGAWSNAENLWVSARWLKLVAFSRVRAESSSHGFAMVVRLVDAALALAGEEV